MRMLITIGVTMIIVSFIAQSIGFLASCLEDSKNHNTSFNVSKIIAYIVSRGFIAYVLFCLINNYYK